jgi:hypothetical protein
VLVSSVNDHDSVSQSLFCITTITIQGGMGMGMVGREQKNYNSFFKNNFPQQLKRKVCGRNVGRTTTTRTKEI